jgi:hypothetical protein
MELPKIHTRVVHSESKNAWNVIGTKIGGRYKIARVPYDKIGTMGTDYNEKDKMVAYEYAVFISTCFNLAYEESLNKKPKTELSPESTLKTWFDFTQQSGEFPLDDFNKVIKMLSKD